jgi:23S rRNA pseudouridine2605 synthase
LRERLQKIIASGGSCSRREAERLIAAGRVTVNGVAAAAGDTADPARDVVAADGAAANAPKRRDYILMYKPRGVVVTRRDEKGRKTVMDLLPGQYRHLVPAGRLDLSSEGLLLLTNDGDVIYNLTHPSRKIKKVYLAWVQGSAAALPPHARPVSPGLLAVTLREGKNRQVRNMCEHAGLHVTRLKRVAEGPLKIGGLKSGQWRLLTEKEIEKLRLLSR